MRAFWLSFHLAAALIAGDSFREIPVHSRSGVLESPGPFLAVGATGWDASSGEPLQIMVRASVDGTRWSRWMRLETAATDSCAEQSSRPSSRLVFFEWNSRYLEYQLGPSTNGLSFVLIDPGRTPERDLQRFRASSTPSAATVELTQPKYISRVEWGSPDGDKARGPLSHAPVQHLIVHHSADNYTGPDYAAWMRAIWNYHVFNNGWVDFGYNWAIAPDGSLYEGRAGGDNVIGAHFSCQNTGTMGVVLLGTFTSGQPTAEARATLAKLLAWKAAQREIDPLGRSLHRGMNSVIDNISGHRDGNGLPGSCTVTACPGDAFYPKLVDIRRDVADLMIASVARSPVVLWSENFDAKPAAGTAVPEGWSADGMWRWWDGMAWFGMPETMTYEPGGAGSLVSPEIGAGQGGEVELRFRSWHDTETARPTGGFDRKFVEISVDGREWQLITEIEDRPRDWTERAFKLDLPVAGAAERKLRIRFRFDTVDDVENAREGWFLDDIQVVAMQPNELR